MKTVLKAIWEAVRELASSLWKATGLVPYLRFIIFGILLFSVIGVIIFQKACDHDSALEKKIDKTQTESVTKGVEVADAKTQAATQDAVTKAAVSRAKDTRKRSYKNSSVADAEKAVADVYPGEVHESTPAERTVPVTQAFVDTATKSAAEVKDLRVANDELQKSSVAKDTVIQKQTELITLKDTELEAYRKLKCEKTSYFFGIIKKTRCK